jgi:signal transduction histidine kinase
MKIHRSLKIYFLFAVISLGVLTVLGFSALTATYFIQGANISMKYSMMQIGKEVDLSKGHFPKQVLGFSIAKRWQDTPILVRRHIAPLSSHMALGKYFDDRTYFKAPTLAVFVLRYDRTPNDVLYISRVFSNIAPADQIKNIPYSLKIIIYAVVAITVFSTLMILWLWRITLPINRLIEWARGLSPEKLNQSIPDFSYKELDNLAAIIRSSLQSVQTSLEREKQFLAQASHELRTPIAVVRTNSQLMEKLIQRDETQEKQRQVLNRILRAGITMTDLCETLLWLNRGEFTNVVAEKVALGELVEQIAHELDYLQREKEIEVHLETEGGSYQLPLTLVRIVLGNLIRNAFQHTYHGCVEISQQGNQVQIRNHDIQPGEAEENLGFGLGLKLTKRIIEHYHWQYEVEEIVGGRDVCITFHSIHPK